MTWQNTYKQLAIYINDSVEDRPNAVAHIYSAVILLTDLTSSGDGAIIETALFDKMYRLYTHLLYTVQVTGDTRNIIKTINDFTIKNYGGNLTSFVNSISWDNGCVPYYWAEYSADMEYDTSEWSICS